MLIGLWWRSSPPNDFRVFEQKTPWHITFLHHPLTTKRIHSSTVQSEFGTVFLMILSIHYSLNNSGVMYLHKLYLRYSTSCGERESRPFREEPETFISILISTAPMHLKPFVMHLALPHCRHVHSHWSGVFNLLKFDHIAKKKKGGLGLGGLSGELRFRVRVQLWVRVRVSIRVRIGVSKLVGELLHQRR